ncbi:MAG: histidine phosphatase family protein [Candidatus Woesearchaeota archaeon]
MKIILTRHGETEENAAGISQGWKPGKLSKLGEQQARLLGERLKDAKIDVIYTSDLHRCIMTAKEIARYHVRTRFIEDNRLRERNLGVFGGRKISKSDWDALEGDLLTNKPKEGESFVKMWERLKDFYEEILKKYRDETILIVGHGGSMCLLQGLIYKKDLGYSLSHIEKLKNTAITEIELDEYGNYKLLLLNSEKHLDS